MHGARAILFLIGCGCLIVCGCAEGPKVEGPKAEQTAAEGPSAGQPVAEGPNAEQPVAEGPKAGQPVADGRKGNEPQQEPLGKDLFLNLCATCHGTDGNGAGPAAEFLFPRPRDFTGGIYKLHSTATGSPPTDADILRSIKNGIPGSAMPSFAFLTEKQRKSLVEYLKSLAVVDDGGKIVRLFKLWRQGRVIDVPAPPKETPALIARGSAVYEAQGCAKCHGVSGEGDGPSAPTLVDRWGYPIPAANFTRGIFKGGDTVSDIYRGFVTGLTGTPMPSFETTISDADRWALAFYVKRLVKNPDQPLTYASETGIRAAMVADFPLDPEAAAWQKAVPATLGLMMTRQRIHAPNFVTVRVLRSATHLGVLLEWEDATADGVERGTDVFSDSAAVMFALTDPPGHFTMGEKEKPSNIWYWRFSRQVDMAVFRPGTSVPKSSVEDLNAIGFGTLTPQEAQDQDVEGRGIWKSGRWKVALVRPLKSAGEDAKFESGKRTSISFAVWDGTAGDRDGQKLVTYWQVLTLD